MAELTRSNENFSLCGQLLNIKVIFYMMSTIIIKKLRFNNHLQQPEGCVYLILPHYVKLHIRLKFCKERDFSKSYDFSRTHVIELLLNF